MTSTQLIIRHEIELPCRIWILAFIMETRVDQAENAHLLLPLPQPDLSGDMCISRPFCQHVCSLLVCIAPV